MTSTNAFTDIEQRFARMMEKARERRAELDAFLTTAPKGITCAAHASVTRPLSIEGSERASSKTGTPTAAYEPCRICTNARHLAEQNERLHRQGVPTNLLHCDLGNWTASNETEEAHLAAVMEFTKSRAGFLVMLGNVGTGKTHLAVAAMRGFSSGVFVKQFSLLRRLRDTYRDRTALDPVAECQQAGILVIDEVGVSSGGRDEFPMLHEILDYRHGELKPTILTGNLGWPELKEVIGARLSDRLKESAAAILSFSGQSHRSNARDRYFAAHD